MSQPHDHDDHNHGPGGHTHGPEDHSHGPGGHSHGPGELQDHDHGPAKPDVPPPVSEDDAGSRALEEALSSSFFIVKGIMLLLLVIFICSGMFTVEQNQVAVVLRFGKPTGEGDEKLKGPGWHWAWPYPIDEVVKIPRGLVHAVRSTVGWYAISKEDELAGKEPAMTGSLNPASDGYCITGDGNIMHSRAVVKYRVTDPVLYAFNYTTASNVVESVVNNALHAVSAHHTVDGATRTNFSAYRNEVIRHATDLLRQYSLGVEIDEQNSTVEVKVPRQVKDAFQEVLNAEQDRSKQINEAQGKSNEMIAKAKGEAEAILSGARADATKLIQAAQADSDSFSKQLPLYQSNPRLFRERLFVETMSRVMVGAQEKFFFPDLDRAQLRLLLNREPLKPNTNSPSGSN